MKKALLVVALLIGASFFAQRHLIVGGSGPADRSAEVEIEDRQDKSAAPLIVRRPPGFGYGSASHRNKTDQLNLITFYPSFRAPTPADRLCRGICDGQILVAIQYFPSAIRKRRFANEADWHSKVYLETYGQSLQPSSRIITVVDIPPVAGFTRVFDNINAAARAETNRVVGRYLLKKSQDGEIYDLAADCSMTTPFHGCQVHFSLACNPAIGVHVTGWPYERIEEVTALRRAVDAFVTSLVQSPKCE